MKPISYSGLSTYSQCPQKYKYSRIDLLPDPPGPAAERGIQVHGQLENAIQDPEFEMPKELAYWRNICTQLSNSDGQTEVELAVTKDYEPCDFKDPKAYVRGIMDLFVVREDAALVGDWKTGKVRDYSEQLRFYQLMVLSAFPKIQRVAGRVYFVDHQLEQNYSDSTQAELPALKEHFGSKITRIQEDQTFTPTPSILCGWCAYSKSKGGPCQAA